MYFNINFFNKENYPNYLHNHFMYEVIIVLFGMLLTYKTLSPIYSGLSVIFLMFWVYFMHYLFHILPKSINPHLAYHHNIEQNSTKIGRIISFIVEIFVDIFLFLNLYLIQKFINYDLIPTILIFYYGLIFLTVHNINYSIFHMGNHPNHHIGDNTTKSYNFGPDSIDHLLGTNYNSNYENFYHQLPDVIFAFLTTSYFFNKSIL